VASFIGAPAMNLMDGVYSKGTISLDAATRSNYRKNSISFEKL
jgi:ABC-type sugar transport system ATPase subunit